MSAGVAKAARRVRSREGISISRFHGAVLEACAAAEVTPFSPGRTRHTVATSGDRERLRPGGRGRVPGASLGYLETDAETLTGQRDQTYRELEDHAVEGAELQAADEAGRTRATVAAILVGAGMTVLLVGPHDGHGWLALGGGALVTGGLTLARW